MKMLSVILLISFLSVSFASPPSKTILLSEPPEGVELTRNRPVVFNIHTALKGSVEFVDSDEFAIIINSTAPSVLDLGRVQYQYVSSRGGELFLQVYESDAPEESAMHVNIPLAIGVLCLLTFLAMVIFSVYWYKEMQPDFLKKLGPGELTVIKVSKPCHCVSTKDSPSKKPKHHVSSKNKKSVHHTVNRCVSSDDELDQEMYKLRAQKMLLQHQLKKKEKLDQISSLKYEVNSLRADLSGPYKPKHKTPLQSAPLELAKKADEQLRNEYRRKIYYDTVEEDVEGEMADDVEEEKDTSQAPLIIRSSKGKVNSRMEVSVAVQTPPRKKKKMKRKPSNSRMSDDQDISSDDESSQRSSLKKSAPNYKTKGTRSPSTGRTKKEGSPAPLAGVEGMSSEAEMSPVEQLESGKDGSHYRRKVTSERHPKATRGAPERVRRWESAQKQSSEDTDVSKRQSGQYITSSEEVESDASSAAHRRILSSGESTPRGRVKKGLGSDDLAWDSDFDYGVNTEEQGNDYEGIIPEENPENYQVDTAENLASQTNGRDLVNGGSDRSGSNTTDDGQRSSSSGSRSNSTEIRPKEKPERKSGAKRSGKHSSSSSESIVTVVTAQTPTNTLTPTTPVRVNPWDSEKGEKLEQHHESKDINANPKPQTSQGRGKTFADRTALKPQGSTDSEGKGKPQKRVLRPQGSSESEGRPGVINGDLDDELSSSGVSSCSGGNGTPSQKVVKGRRANRQVPGKRIHMTTIALVSILGLLSGVYSQLVTETEVHIKIMIPKDMVKKGSVVIAAEGRHVELINAPEGQVVLYDVVEPHVKDLQAGISRCHRKKCADRCDLNTGDCMCRRGHRQEQDGICSDINECTESNQKCDENAVCRNTEGSYKCFCKAGYYGNGLSCRSCRIPCPPGSYEQSPCDGNAQTRCQACLKSCPPNHYARRLCNSSHNRECLPCNAPCKQGEYEVTSCTETTNRVCRPSDAIQPITYGNVWNENVLSLSSQRTIRWYLDDGKFAGQKNYILKRGRDVPGNDISMHISIRHVNLSPTFKASDRRHDHENEEFAGDTRILTDYCPHPMPEKYELILVMHNNIATKAKYNNCSEDVNPVENCQDGFTIDPNQPCETYQQFGNSLLTQGAVFKTGSVLCTEPSRLTDMFGVSNLLTRRSTFFVENNERCATKNNQCESCSKQCGEVLLQNSGNCKVTGDEQDNGFSPRLDRCYLCCMRQNCTEACNGYQTGGCKTIRCIQGNMAEFVLNPIFPTKSTSYHCHVQPSSGKMFDIRYAVHYKGKRIADKTFRINQDTNAEDLVKKVAEFPLLNLHYSSGFTEVPELVHGDVQTVGTYGASSYVVEGNPVEGPITSGNALLVRSTLPWGISTYQWRSKTCSVTSLDNLLLSEVSPFRQLNDIAVSYLGKAQYQVHNITAQSYLYFEIPENTTFLAHFFNRTAVVDDGTLKGDIQRNSTHWLVNVRGKVDPCPGLITLKIYEDWSRDYPVFKHDLAVSCPTNFKVTVPFPTQSPVSDAKGLTVEVQGLGKTVYLRLYKQAERLTTVVETDDAVVSAASVSKTYPKQSMPSKLSWSLIIGVASAALILLLILVMGSLYSAKKISVDSRYHTRHMILTICYVVFRTAYSCAMTFTVFVLVWVAANSPHISTLKEYPGFMQSVSALQKLEVKDVTRHIQAEIKRQNSAMNATIARCQNHLQTVQDQVLKAQRDLASARYKQRVNEKVSVALQEQVRAMMTHLTEKLIIYRAEYNSYVKSAIDGLVHDIRQTQDKILDSPWLEAAKLVHGRVDTLRSAKGERTKNLNEWLRLKPMLQELQRDLTMSPLPLPDMAEFSSLDVSAVNIQKLPQIFTSTIPRNDWFVWTSQKIPQSISQNVTMTIKRLQDRPVITWNVFILLVLGADLLWFLHRGTHTFMTAKKLLQGSPHYVDCTQKREEEEEPGHQDHCRGMCCKTLGDMNARVMKTEFVPKLAGVVLVCCFVYFLLASTETVVSVQTLANLGYFKSLMTVSSIEKITMTKLQANLERINKVELPYYQQVTSVHLERYQTILKLINEFDCRERAAHAAEWCSVAKDSASCSKINHIPENVVFSPCDIPPIAVHMKEGPGRHVTEDVLVQGVMPFIQALQDIVINTCHMLLLFVAVLVLIDLASQVVWLFLQRFHIVREQLVFQTNTPVHHK